MIPNGSAIGVCMADAKVVSNTGKRPFVVFKIECSDERMKYPMRVDCLVYPRMNEDPNVVASKYRQGHAHLGYRRCLGAGLPWQE